MSSKLLVNTAYYGLVPAIPKIVSIFLLPLLTLHLTSEDYGIAGTIVAYTSAIAAFSTLGCSAFITSSFYHYGNNFILIWRQIYGFLQYWMIAFAILQSVLLYYVIPDSADENKLNIIILAGLNNVIFGPSAIFGSLYYRLQQKPKPVVFRSFLSGIITVLSNLLFIVYLELGYMGWYISSFIGTFFVNATYWYVLNFKLDLRPAFLLKTKVVKHVLKVSLPTIPHYYSTYLINGSNKFIMDRFHTPLSAIGRFNFASEFFSYFDLFATSVNSAVSPMFMEYLKKNEIKKSQEVFKQSLMIFSIVVVSFIIWSPQIFEILVKNDELKDTYGVASILVAGFIHRPVYLAISSAMFYYEKTSSLMKISLSSGIFAFIGYIVFIPLWGIEAAAIITFFALTIIGYLGFILKSTRKLYPLPYNVLIIFLVLNLLVLFAFALMEASFFLKILICFFIYLFFILKYKKL